jgi:alkanesulfonate monooxygenase SsuD/methylene tetrahydromethanopterin reductase-like flavin-dependent oxidoreductase (luciferase family)
MTGTGRDPVADGARYRAAIDMAAFADRSGFDVVNVEEHHGADCGWLSSPITMAAMIAARTERITISACALLLPLYDPLRLAEDIAMIDLVSNGRFNFVAGLGYRPGEYRMMQRAWRGRGKRMDEIIATLLQAWRGEPFEYEGETVRVTPVPQTRPHPFFFIGGLTKPAARRAARFGLPFYPPVHDRELEAYYHEELARHGKTGFFFSPKQQPSMLFIDENPDRAWAEIGPCFLREIAEYSGWERAGIPHPFAIAGGTVDAVRASRRYEILTPEECLHRVRESDPSDALVLHPLAGGIPLDRAWRSLELYRDGVLEPLRR